MTKVRTRSNSASASVPVSKQVKIQFQDEGVDLGEIGTVDEVDFTGSGLSATRSGNKVTVNSTGGGGGAVTSGSGTTANGTAVDLGGAITAPVSLPGTDVDFVSNIVNTAGTKRAQIAWGVSDGAGNTSGLGVYLVGVAQAFDVTHSTGGTIELQDAGIQLNVPTGKTIELAGVGGLAVSTNNSIVTKVYADTKQPLDADLTAIAALTSAADKLPYATGAQAWALTDLSSFMRTLLDDATAADARTTLGITGGATFALPIGSLSFNPADATTYYFAGLGLNVFVPTGTASSHAFTTPNYDFTIIGAIIQAGLNSTQGSSELSTMQLRNLTDLTSTTIGTFASNGTGTQMVCTTINGLSIAVPASKSIAIQVDTATWATNPIATRWSVALIITIP